MRRTRSAGSSVKVLGDHGQELVFGPVRLPDGGHVPDDALEADHRPLLVAGEGRDVELPAYAVGAEHLEVDLAVLGAVETGEGVALTHDGEHLLEARPLQVEGGDAEDGG
jgi:hypothetical protein